ncbi:putative Glycoside hydrolase superfamily [Seiridium unicorne]|uniref:alpha-galactosidase n=1 Tax=Seiridium unicorne TaxID=138068 RepID=A0ABR2UV31_9PEZI
MQSAVLSLFAGIALGSPSPRSHILTPRAVAIPQGAKWQIEIHDPIDFSGSGTIEPADARIWTLDFWETIAKDDDGKTAIQKLRERNGDDILVVCYFNGGGVQIWDGDYDSFAGYTYGGIGDWDGESYVDVSAQTVVDLMLARIEKGIAAGCDGFDPDNVDAYSQDLTSKDGTTKLDESAYVTFLGKLAEPIHAAGKLLGQKNAGELTADLLAGGITDFAVLESCLEYGFCADFASTYGEQGKAVLQIEYPASVQATTDNDDTVCPTEPASDADYETVCGSIFHGFSTVIKQDGGACGLNGFAQYCDGASVVVTPTES